MVDDINPQKTSNQSEGTGLIWYPLDSIVDISTSARTFAINVQLNQRTHLRNKCTIKSARAPSQ